MTFRLLLVALLTVGGAVAACAACPQVVADCLGQAAAFDLVAENLKINRGTMAEFGEGVSHFGATIGDACAPTAFVGGGFYCRTEVDNLILTAPSGIAARFASLRCGGEVDNPAVDVAGDVVTGGGVLANEEAMRVINGMIDTSGADSRVGTCAQALTDMRTAAADLAALTPTRDLGAVRPDPDGVSYVTLTADPGVNVWTASELTARTKHLTLSEHTTSIGIALDPATESVIINVGKVFVGVDSRIWVNGDTTKVILNVAGVVRNSGHIQPGILAPDGKVLLRILSDAGPVYGGSVQAYGAYVQ